MGNSIMYLRFQRETVLVQISDWGVSMEIDVDYELLMF